MSRENARTGTQPQESAEVRTLNTERRTLHRGRDSAPTGGIVGAESLPRSQRTLRFVRFAFTRVHLWLLPFPDSGPFAPFAVSFFSLSSASAFISGSFSGGVYLRSLVVPFGFGFAFIRVHLRFHSFFARLAFLALRQFHSGFAPIPCSRTACFWPLESILSTNIRSTRFSS